MYTAIQYTAECWATSEGYFEAILLCNSVQYSLITSDWLVASEMRQKPTDLMIREICSIKVLERLYVYLIKNVCSSY